ncbi:unnamed protein product [Lepeophtheirus salmonis]|uniref:(salmon louse) hypothetical protein n=1 Tax=Lepeophtheirus salmonis TaxID=72036 RepID=A0A817FE16_LEPSM|nr:unnamed protein product [Lepeophtheirus salmonis]CAG9477393.1 unnamed protein product [Lepeophtheirus salmonis]
MTERAWPQGEEDECLVNDSAVNCSANMPGGERWIEVNGMKEALTKADDWEIPLFVNDLSKVLRASPVQRQSPPPLHPGGAKKGAQNLATNLFVTNSHSSTSIFTSILADSFEVRKNLSSLLTRH